MTNPGPRLLSLMADALGDSIRDLGEVPSGHLYAMVMNHLDLEGYQAVIDVLKRRGDVKEDGSHMLRWTGKAAS